MNNMPSPPIDGSSIGAHQFDANQVISGLKLLSENCVCKIKPDDPTNVCME